MIDAGCATAQVVGKIKAALETVFTEGPAEGLTLWEAAALGLICLYIGSGIGSNLVQEVFRWLS